MNTDLLQVGLKAAERSGFNAGFLSAMNQILEILKNNATDENGDVHDFGIMDYCAEITYEMKCDPNGFMDRYSIKRKEGVA